MSRPADAGRSAPPPPADLLEAATRAFRNAYAPYSRFRVGSALRASDGSVIPGSNVENAAYGVGRCAEQSAVQAMATRGLRRFDEIVVVSDAPEPASPCGACRQVLFEFAPEARVWMVNLDGVVRFARVEELLPGGFRLSDAPEAHGYGEGEGEGGGEGGGGEPRA